MGREAGGAGRRPQAPGAGVVSVGPGIPEAQRYRFAGTPPEHQAVVEELVLQEGLVSEAYPGRVITGLYYSRPARTVVLSPSLATQKNARHELGHAVWDAQILTSRQMGQFAEEHTKTMFRVPRREHSYGWGEVHYISGYATTNYGEAFAELYSNATSGAAKDGARFGRATPRQQGIMRDILGDYCKW